MTKYTYCTHALSRLQQRGRRTQDIDLILRYGTIAKSDGIILLKKDVDNALRDLKALAKRLQRLTNWKVVLKGQTIITVYCTSRRHQKYKLKN